MSLIQWSSKLIVKHPRLNLVLLLIITLLFAAGLLHLRLDTSLSAFVIRNDPDMRYYNILKELFETDETIVIGFKADDLFAQKDLAFIQNLSKKIEAIPFVRNVRSLTTANLITTTPEMFEVKALVDTLPQSRQDSERIHSHATTNYLYAKDLASLDGRFASILVDIQNDPGSQRTKKVMQRIQELLGTETKHTAYKLYLAGDAIINYSLGEYMQRDFFVFIIPIYLLMAVLMRLTMGRWRDALVSLLVVSCSLIWSMGTLALMGKTINNVTIGIIPLIFCIALENIYYIHDMYYNRLRRTLDPRAAFREALTLILRPCYFASFTTVLGFASLMINCIKPIVDFGILGSIAAMLAFIISSVLIPSFHLLLKIPADLEKAPSFKINAASLIKALTRFIERRKHWYWAGIPVFLCFAVLGIMRIRTETDHLEFFHKKSTVYTSTSFIENNIAGVSNLEITVDTHREDGIKNPAVLHEIDKLTAFIRQLEKVDKAMSIVDFLKDMNRAMNDNNPASYAIPETQEAVAQYLLVYSMSPRRNDIEKDFVDYPYRLARIRCRMSEHNSVKTITLVNQIKAFAEKNLDPTFEVKITSYPVIYANMVNAITEGQLYDLLFVCVTLLITACIYFRSFRLGALAMIPNVIPIIFTFSFMGWTGITLNVGTALTAGIAIGLAMDDTTHFLNRFRIEHRADDDYAATMRNTLSLLGEPMMFSSLVMIASYLVLVFSQFRLTAFFGFLCALTTFVALWCDLLITPWILITFKPKLTWK